MRILACGNIVIVKFCARVIHNPPAVGRGEAHIVFLVVRVALQVRAVRQAGIEVRDSLIVRHKVDALANPHRSGVVALGGFEEGEGSRAVAVNPEHACRAAPIAFPAGGVHRVAPDNHPAVRTEADGMRDSVGVHAWLTPFAGHAPEPYLAWRAACRAVIDNLVAVGRPADHTHHRRALIGEALRLAPLCGDDIDLRMPLIPRHEGNPFAVRRIVGGADHTEGSGEPSGDTSLSRNRP